MILNADDIRKHVTQAEDNYERTPTFERHSTLAVWVIAEQLYEIRHSLAAFREVIGPAAGEDFPAVVRVRNSGGN